jgi:hypothetical protein
MEAPKKHKKAKESAFESPFLNKCGVSHAHPTCPLSFSGLDVELTGCASKANKEKKRWQIDNI